MGASLGCCGGPSADYDAAFMKTTTARYYPLLGRCDVVEKSMLEKLQRSISKSWSSRLVLGGGVSENVRSPHGQSHAGSRYGLDEHYESESDSDDDDPASSTRRGGGNGSIASATSGSRLLCDFYNLVLECDHSKFFVDANGRRVKGAYLNQVEIWDDYFDVTRRTTVGSRRRRRSSMDVLLPYQPPQKLKHLGTHPNYDRLSNMSLMSNDTTSDTLASETDYWATCFEDGPSEPVDVFEMTFPPNYGQLQLTPVHHGARSRRDSGSADRRRAYLPFEQQISLDSTSSSFLLFSPVNASSLTEQQPAPTLTRQRSSSRMGRPTTASASQALPTEGSRCNLWDAVYATNDDVVVKPSPPKAAVLPTAFSSAAVSERRRASLTMGQGANNSTASTSNRRLSAHTIAPIAV